MLGDHPFALCLTHDVDRPYKTYQSLYYAVRERPGHHLKSALPWVNPYWQFESVMELEASLGVRSAFYFLNEPPMTRRGLRQWASPRAWIEHLCRYDVTAPDVADVIRELDDGGWEVGLHGSYHSHADRARLAEEQRVLESVLGRPVAGVRQHYLNLDGLETWRHHDALGFAYDASLGSSTECGFHHGYVPIKPFGRGSEFVVFPLTVMESALPDPDARFEAAVDACEALLTEAAANDAVMTALWHPRFFDPDEFPGYRRLYRRLLERAVEMGAWIGPPGDLCEQLGRHDDRLESSVPVRVPRVRVRRSKNGHPRDRLRTGESGDAPRRSETDAPGANGTPDAFVERVARGGGPSVASPGARGPVGTGRDDGTRGDR